jgi:hypothetical protein
MPSRQKPATATHPLLTPENQLLLKGDPASVAQQLLRLLPDADPDSSAAHPVIKQTIRHTLTVIVGALQACGQPYTLDDLLILLQSAQALTALEVKTPSGNAKMALQVFLDQYRKRTADGTVLDVVRLKLTLGDIISALEQQVSAKPVARAQKQAV